jgi:hypothetical protein
MYFKFLGCSECFLIGKFDTDNHFRTFNPIKACLNIF